MTRGIFGSLSVVALVCLSAAHAFAQTEIDDARKARIQYNGLYITPTFRLKEIGIDTNVFNQSGSQTPDFTFTVTPAAKIDVPIERRALIESNVSADLVYYAQYASQRSVDPNVTLRATGFLQRVKFFAEGDYLNSRQIVNQEIDARARRTDSAVLIGLEYRVFPKISVVLSGRFGRIDYADDQFFNDVNLQTALAEDQRIGTVALNYRWTPLTTFALKADVQRDTFLYSPLKDGTGFRIMPGVEFKPRALISGSAYVGYRDLQPTNSFVPDYQGLAAALSLRYALQAATIFRVAYDRDVQYSYLQETPYYVSNSIGVTIRRQLTGSFDTTLSVQKYTYDYQDILTGVQAALAIAPRVDVTHYYGADIGYRLRKIGRLGFGLAYRDRESNRDSTANYHGFRVGSTVNYEF